VSVAVLNPVHWSTTVIGEAAVVRPAAQAGMAASRFTTPWAQLAQERALSTGAPASSRASR
jgi:hypothetical protein